MIRLAKNAQIIWIFAVSLSAALAGCVTGGGSSSDAGRGVDGRVVERSRPDVPAWANLAIGRIHETEAGLQYVEMQTRLRDLPLGVKQTQLGALEASRKALTAVVKDRIEADHAAMTSYGAQEFDRAVEAIMESTHEQAAKVTDIYFEKIEDDSGQDLPQYFNAYVLITIPREQFDGAMFSLARRLAESSDAGLRDLGQRLTIQTSPNPPTVPVRDDLAE